MRKLIPQEILHDLGSDAYHLLWAAQPELLSNEDGSTPSVGGTRN